MRVHLFSMKQGEFESGFKVRNWKVFEDFTVYNTYENEVGVVSNDKIGWYMGDGLPYVEGNVVHSGVPNFAEVDRVPDTSNLVQKSDTNPEFDWNIIMLFSGRRTVEEPPNEIALKLARKQYLKSFSPSL